MFFKKILLAITPSPESDYAAKEAIALARENKARLYVFHACGVEYGWGQVRHLIPCGETEKMKTLLREYYQKMTDGLPDVSYEVTAGLPHTEILRFARKQKIDLIVMGPRMHPKKLNAVRPSGGRQEAAWKRSARRPAVRC
jgi:nucleotide-binding universal stress UspA family protein